VRGLLVFDGDCAFCTSSVDFTRRRVRPPADIEPWQRLDLAALGLTEAACRQAVQYRDRDGTWTSAGRAAAELLRESPRPWSLLGRFLELPVLSWLTERLYRVVSANRHRLPGGTPACRIT
jgi:predicted DCC family thiol-disulfide oxidoreductase YuxK